MAFEKATPRPWTRGTFDSTGEHVISPTNDWPTHRGGGSYVARQIATADHAALIVHAVNLHEEYVAAARLLVEANRNFVGGTEEGVDAYNRAYESALAKFRALLAKEDAQ